MFQLRQKADGQAKILIVDDRLDNLELLSTICTLQGFEVVTCDCGELAIELAEKVNPHVILLDINMPKMDGFTVCQMLKDNSFGKNIPIIFITASKEVESKNQAFELGGNDYITKPFQVEDVVARVKVQLKFHDVQTELTTKNQQLTKETKERHFAETKLLKLNHKLVELTTLDSSTNLANQAYFEEILAKEWKRGTLEKTNLSIILCDIDYFKLYQDRFGHQAKDICLKQVAQKILKTANRSGDLVALYRSEKFAVLLPQTKAEDAMVLAEKIRQQIEQLGISHPDSLASNYISLSLGIALIIPTSSHTKKQLLSTAQVAVYEAKQQGGNRAILKTIN